MYNTDNQNKTGVLGIFRKTILKLGSLLFSMARKHLPIKLRISLANFLRRAPWPFNTETIHKYFDAGQAQAITNPLIVVLQKLSLSPNMHIYNQFIEQGYYCVCYPSTLAIFLTTNCNLRCFICRREGFKGQNLEFENIFKLINPIRFAKTIDLTGWGEPFIYPKFVEILDFIYSINPMKLIQITTNGTRL